MQCEHLYVNGRCVHCAESLWIWVPESATLEAQPA